MVGEVLKMFELYRGEGRIVFSMFGCDEDGAGKWEFVGLFWFVIIISL